MSLDAISEFHLGMYGQSTVQLPGNPELPARGCIRDSSVPPTLNRVEIDLGAVARDPVDWFVDERDTTEGAVLVTCEDVALGDY